MADPLGVLYQTLFNYLTNKGDWSDRVFADEASATITRPYLVFFLVGGGELNAVRHEDAEFVLTVKVVASNLASGFAGADQINNLLNDRGKQDVTSAPLSAVAGSGWQILTITKERSVYILEKFENAAPIYHVGNQYRFRMESE